MTYIARNHPPLPDAFFWGSNALSVLGTFALVVYAFPWLGLVFIPLGFVFVSLAITDCRRDASETASQYICASYYRMTSREVKRVDSILRSAIYGSFGEQLAGLAVIRAFGQQRHFMTKMQESINTECVSRFASRGPGHWLLTVALQQAYIITVSRTLLSRARSSY